MTSQPECRTGNLYKARDLCREKRKGVEQAIKIAAHTGDKKAEREATKTLKALDKREEAVVTEIKMRRGPITRLVRRGQGRDWRTGKFEKKKRRGSSRRSSAGGSSSVLGGGDPFIEGALDKTGAALQSPFDLIWDFIENVATSTKLRAESLKFW